MSIWENKNYTIIGTTFMVDNTTTCIKIIVYISKCVNTVISVITTLRIH